MGPVCIIMVWLTVLAMVMAGTTGAAPTKLLYFIKTPRFILTTPINQTLQLTATYSTTTVTITSMHLMAGTKMATTTQPGTAAIITIPQTITIHHHVHSTPAHPATVQVAAAAGLTAQAAVQAAAGQHAINVSSL